MQNADTLGRNAGQNERIAGTSVARSSCGRATITLNGPWDYAITASDACPGSWDGQILVPFSPEAPLSGVGRALKPEQVLWYRRTLPPLQETGMRTLLHFGAVDQRAAVYLNGLLAGMHTAIRPLPLTLQSCCETARTR